MGEVLLVHEANVRLKVEFWRMFRMLATIVVNLVRRKGRQTIKETELMKLPFDDELKDRQKIDLFEMATRMGIKDVQAIASILGAEVIDKRGKDKGQASNLNKQNG